LGLREVVERDRGIHPDLAGEALEDELVELVGREDGGDHAAERVLVRGLEELRRTGALDVGERAGEQTHVAQRHDRAAEPLLAVCRGARADALRLERDGDPRLGVRHE
jgi:hypothetical protein